MGKSYKSGKATVKIDQDMEKMFLGFLKTVAPSAQSIMDEDLKEIERKAQMDWPRRQPIIRRDETGDIVFQRRTSQESWKKFRRGVQVTSDGSFTVFLRNTAPYSWAIKFGEDSRNNQGREIIQPQGRRVATELLVKPHRKSARKVVKALAADLIKKI